MRKYKIYLLLFLIMCCVFNSITYATDNVDIPLKNIELVQLQLLDNGNGLLSVYYCYPMTDGLDKIEKEDLISEDFTLSISELTFHEAKRYATVSCTILYQDINDLFTKIQQLKGIDSQYQKVLFNFYVLLDSIASNLNFQTIEDGTVSLTIDTSSFTNQKYYMTNLDAALCEKLSNIDTQTIRDVDTIFYLITPNNIEVFNAEQFNIRVLNDIYTEYSSELNNQQLHITLSKKNTQPIVPDDELPDKLEQFLDSKWYYFFMATGCVFVVVAVVVMIFIAKSYTKVIEIEEKKIMEEERKTHSQDDPQLYWTKEERDFAKKKKKMMKNPNALVRDADIESQTESVENTPYKRQNHFHNNSS